VRPLAYADQAERLAPGIGTLVRADAIVGNAQDAAVRVQI
jgi:hypothetical protein